MQILSSRVLPLLLPILLVSFWAQPTFQLLYDDGLIQVSQAILKSRSSWTAKLNPVFIGKDLDFVKSVLGIKPDFLSRLSLVKEVHKIPTLAMKGRDKQPSQQNNSRNNPNRNPQGLALGLEKQANGLIGGGLNGLHNRAKRDLPQNYDWRDYSYCKSFYDVRYQTCGDCWAVSSAAAMSDRYCLYTRLNKYFSAKQLASCVYGSEGGCSGGYPDDAAKYYYNTGVASGGDPTISSEPAGCQPYPSRMTNYIQCPSYCQNGAYLDSTRAGDYSVIASKNVTKIQQEIYVYGSVVACFEVFQDFPYAGTGVYQHVWGQSQGWHAVRIIGWGVDDQGVPYWLCVNQWGTGFGDNGYFKILRGYNHCGIESWITGVYPIEAWYQ